MNNSKFLTFVFLLLPFTFAACGSSSSGGGGIGGATSLTGTVYAPNGSDPVAGATIYIPSGSASVSAKGKTLFNSAKTSGADGTTCADPAEASCGSTCSGANGSFTMDVTACSTSSSTMKIVKGGLTVTATLSCGSDATCTLAAASTTFSGTDPAETPKMAVVTGQYDRIEDVLAKLGFGSLNETTHQLDTTKTFNFTLIDAYNSPAYDSWSLYLDGTKAMSDFDIIFINCGNSYDSSTYLTDAAKTHISDFVTNGGKLYVTDQAYEFINQVFPGFMQFEGDTKDPPTAGPFWAADLGKPDQAINATVGDTTMKDWLKNVTVIQSASSTVSTTYPGNPGTYDDCHQSTFTPRVSALNTDDSIPIGDFWGGWAEMVGKQSGTGVMDPTLWITGTVEEEAGGSTSRPLTASVGYGTNGGKIAYSSYHTAESCASAYFWPQERILEYLVLETF